MNALQSITSKPWNIFGCEEEDTGSVMVSTGDHDDFCEFFSSDIHTVKQTRSEVIAAARLMVASPQLLKALQAIVECSNEQTIAQAKAALAKAGA